MRFLVVLVMATLASDARADAVAFTCSAAPNILPINKGGACKGFVALDANKHVVQRVANAPSISGRILATPDGKTVAMLHSSPLTSLDFASQPALVFYQGGKAIAMYTMAELIVRMELVSQSMSHTMWLARGHSKLELGKTLELTTTSQRTYSFDIATGKQLSADDTEDWKSCELIVYAAERVPFANGVFTIAKPWLAKGTVKAPLVLRASAGVRVDSGSTICVMPTKPGWVATKNLDVMFNRLPH